MSGLELDTFLITTMPMDLMLPVHMNHLIKNKILEPMPQES